jgi:hypothetical protein
MMVAGMPADGEPGSCDIGGGAIGPKPAIEWPHLSQKFFAMEFWFPQFPQTRAFRPPHLAHSKRGSAEAVPHLAQRIWASADMAL